VAAIFELIYTLAADQLQAAREDDGARGVTALQTGTAEAERHRFLEGRILELLDLLRDSGAVDFQAFTDRESEQFKDGFTATVERLDGQLGAAGERA
jgi:hypothetical protein